MEAWAAETEGGAPVVLQGQSVPAVLPGTVLPGTVVAGTAQASIAIVAGTPTTPNRGVAVVTGTFVAAGRAAIARQLSRRASRPAGPTVVDNDASDCRHPQPAETRVGPAVTMHTIRETAVPAEERRRMAQCGDDWCSMYPETVESVAAQYGVSAADVTEMPANQLASTLYWGERRQVRVQQSCPKDMCANCMGKGKVDSFDDEFFYGVPRTSTMSSYEDNTRGSRKSFGAIDCCCWLGSCCCFCTAFPFVKRECQRCKGTGFVVQAKVQVDSPLGGFGLREGEGAAYWSEGYTIKSRWVPLGGICAGGYQVSRTGDEVLVPWHGGDGGLGRWVPRPPPSSESMGRV